MAQQVAPITSSHRKHVRCIEASCSENLDVRGYGFANASVQFYRALRQRVCAHDSAVSPHALKSACEARSCACSAAYLRRGRQRAALELHLRRVTSSIANEGARITTQAKGWQMRACMLAFECKLGLDAYYEGRSPTWCRRPDTGAPSTTG
eukprot:4932210-Pleurochrysis_carterae.AAC.1